MPEQLWITELLNRFFAGPANAVLSLLHIQAKYPQAPIDNTFAMEFLVFVLLMSFFLLVRASFSVDRPGALQHIVESAEGFIQNQSHDIIGHGSASSSFTLRTGSEGCTTSMLVTVTACVTGAKSRRLS